jgi:hypothetical protein
MEEGPTVGADGVAVPRGPTLFRFLLASLGRKPGAKRPLGLLPTSSDLPGGPWDLVVQRTWRASRISRISRISINPDRARRAKAIGSISALRLFKQAGSQKRLSVQLVPHASPEDASFALQNIPNNHIRSRTRFPGTLVP